MKVIRTQNSGFCSGVKNAIDTALSLKGEGNYILGEIIHNECVVEKLKNSGLNIVNSIDEIDKANVKSVLIRTHGEPPTTYQSLKDLNCKVYDCTCPFVKKIQEIVKERYKLGYKIVIIGNKNHPEVIATNGWCDNTALIVENADELSAINDNKICIVVQTTFKEKKFDEIIKNFVYDKSKIVDIFKTICYTTTRRQKETEILAKKCDAVLCLGGKFSSNTKELFNICLANCKNVFMLNSPSQFNYEKIKNFNKVGVVLGASTPIEQFQEVIQNMEEITKDVITEIAAEESAPAVAEVATETVEAEVKATAPAKKPISEFEAAFNKIAPPTDYRIGQVVTAKISSAGEKGLTISIKNAKKDFELAKEDLLNEYNKDEYKEKEGQSIRVMVIGKNPLRFSEKAMVKILAEEAEIELIKNGKLFEADITETNKGGLTGKFGSYTVFVPSSQIRLGFVKDLEKYVGKKLTLKAEKVETRRRQIVGSHKVILEAEKAERDAARLAKEEEFFANVQEGDIVLGTPVRFAAFGAFIDVNGFDCLAHISDLSWTGCKNCADVLEIGKQYEFKVLKLDAEAKRVSVGYKQLQPKPWDLVAEKYNVGDVIKGKVVRILNFGAFVEIEKGIDGLIHVSEISNKYLENPATALEIGQEVEVKIIDINTEKEKMSLSIKALLPEEEVKVEEEVADKKGKKRAKKEETVEEPELHEWKDDNGGVSIAEMINN
ncbi:MAG: 4-hydroxy-3-methylbut-2-enyl diphosphate reductase [Clostridia bacterium]|nr:4-hydroxy-3-methylbut-2-enyl diphosphate reductase [Clostridia bacterium]